MLDSPNGCIDQAQEKLGSSGEPFFDRRNKTLFRTLVQLHDERVAIDLVTLADRLRNQSALEDAGGLSYVSELYDVVPSALNLPAYLDIVHHKFLLRQLINTCTEVSRKLYCSNGHESELIAKAQSQVLNLLAPIGRSVTQEHWDMKSLYEYDFERDPNAVIGIKDGKTTRYLCRGYSAWIIGQSGIGKSTLGEQMCYLWSLGKPFFGILPVRALRCLIVQNENDLGDCAETTQGILDCCAITPEEFSILQKNVKIIRCRGKTGPEFCRWLESEILNWSADLIYVDPLLRFAGIDVSRQDQCTKFLNDHLDPVLARTGVVMIGAHHTGKPKPSKDTKGWTIYDMAYSGIGSSELVNWARAILILRVCQDDSFELLLSKRGPRAWATTPSGNPTTSIFLKHSTDRVFWEQIEPPETKHSRSEKTNPGRPNIVVQIASMNLYSFCAACLPEGEALRPIARRLESWLAKEKVDASHATCRRAVAALVANGKLTKKEDSTYTKGPNA